MENQEEKQDYDGTLEPKRLADEVESRLRDYLSKAESEFPPDCQADWLASDVAERLLNATASASRAASDGQHGDDRAQATAAATPVSLVKLSIYLMESLADVSNAYEEFYGQQIAELRDESVAAHAQVGALEDENARLREQLHRRAEELREAQAAAATLKSAAAVSCVSATALDGGIAGRHRFDEAVDVEEDEDEVADDVAERTAEAAEIVESVCSRCRRGGGDNREAAEAAAVQIAALKADLADWEADMAEKVHQNVELAAQLEACQRQLARLQKSGAAPVASPAPPRGIFSVMPLLKRKN